MEMKKVIHFILLFILINTLFATEMEKKFWRPVWDKPKKKIWYRVLPSSKKNVFLVQRYKAFSTKEAAERYKSENERVMHISKGDGNFYCLLLEPMDITPLLKKEACPDIDWQSKEAQYFLFKALQREHNPDNRIENGVYYHYMKESFDSEEELAESLRKKNKEIVKKKWKNIDDNQKVLKAIYRYPVDIIGKAAYKYRGLMGAYKYLIPEHIGYYKCIGAGAGGQASSKYGKLAGITGSAGYINNDTPGPGSSGCTIGFMMAEKENAFDHEFYRDMALSGSIITQTIDGNTVFALKDRAVAWKSDKKTYYECSSYALPVIRTYLKKFPSILKKDAKFDEQEWKRKEMDICLKHLEKHARAGKKDDYLILYGYMIRFFKPIKGAPAFYGRDIELSPKELAYHFSLIKEWWKKNRETFHFKPGRILTGWEIGKYNVYKSGGESIIEDFRKQAEKAGVEIPGDEKNE